MHNDVFFDTTFRQAPSSCLSISTVLAVRASDLDHWEVSLFEVIFVALEYASLEMSGILWYIYAENDDDDDATSNQLWFEQLSIP